MLATSKNVLFPGYNHLLTTSTDDHFCMQCCYMLVCCDIFHNSPGTLLTVYTTTSGWRVLTMQLPERTVQIWIIVLHMAQEFVQITHTSYKCTSGSLEHCLLPFDILLCITKLTQFFLFIHTYLYYLCSTPDNSLFHFSFLFFPYILS